MCRSRMSCSKTRKVHYFFLFWFFLVITPVTISATTVSLNVERDEYSLGKHLEILEDKEGKWELKDVTSSALSNNFIQSSALVPNFGYTDSVYWVRFRLKSSLPAGSDNIWLLEVNYPAIDSVTLYMPDSFGNLVTKTTGDLLSFKDREIPYRNFLFRLFPEPDEETTYYLRFQTTSSMQIPLSIWSQKGFVRKTNYEMLGFGFFYGFVLVMSMYNLILCLKIRDVNHFFYVFQTLIFGMTQLSMNGLAYELFWPNSPALANRSIPFFVGAVSFSGAVFSFNVLNLNSYLPVVYRLRRILYFPACAIMVLSIVGPIKIAILASVYTVLAYLVMVMLIAIYTWAKGYLPARYLTIGWAGLLTGSFILGIQKLGIVPRNFLTDYSGQIGAMAEIFFLSLALSDRINLLKRDKEVADKVFAVERGRIAKDLHDVVGSTLSDMLLSVKRVKDRHRLTAILQENMGKIVEKMRDVIFILNQSENFAATLEIAMEERIQFLNNLEKYEVKASFDQIGVRLGVNRSLHLYKIYLEWITNTLKHANPESITVKWRLREEYAVLAIGNDGASFSWGGLIAGNNGFGLGNIVERTRSMKAKARSFAFTNNKTVFIIRIPLQTE